MRYDERESYSRRRDGWRWIVYSDTAHPLRNGDWHRDNRVRKSHLGARQLRRASVVFGSSPDHSLISVQ